MTDLKRKTIANQVIRLAQENARMRVALTEIAFRCEQQLEFIKFDGWRTEPALTHMRDTAKKALEPEGGTPAIKKS